jgi:hypothetical protein
MIAQKLAKVPKGLNMIAKKLAMVPNGLDMIAEKLAKVPIFLYLQEDIALGIVPRTVIVSIITYAERMTQLAIRGA